MLNQNPNHAKDISTPQMHNSSTKNLSGVFLVCPPRDKQNRFKTASCHHDLRPDLRGIFLGPLGSTLDIVGYKQIGKLKSRQALCKSTATYCS